jgi:hypothetical protein
MAGEANSMVSVMVRFRYGMKHPVARESTGFLFVFDDCFAFVSTSSNEIQHGSQNKKIFIPISSVKEIFIN